MRNLSNRNPSRNLGPPRTTTPLSEGGEKRPHLALLVLGIIYSNIVAPHGRCPQCGGPPTSTVMGKKDKKNASKQSAKAAQQAAEPVAGGDRIVLATICGRISADNSCCGGEIGGHGERTRRVAIPILVDGRNSHQITRDCSPRKCGDVQWVGRKSRLDHSQPTPQISEHTVGSAAKRSLSNLADGLQAQEAVEVPRNVETSIATAPTPPRKLFSYAAAAKVPPKEPSHPGPHPGSRRTRDPNELVYLFIDNSNIWIEAKKTVPQLLELPVPELSPLRIEYGKLVDVILRGRQLGKRGLLVGSKPPDADTIWPKFEKYLEVRTRDRNSQNKEKGIDVELAMRAAQVVLQEPQKGTILFIAGDGDYVPVVEMADCNGWKAEFWFWSHCNIDFKEMGIFNSLDHHFFRFCYCAEEPRIPGLYKLKFKSVGPTFNLGDVKLDCRTAKNDSLAHSGPTKLDVGLSLRIDQDTGQGFTATDGDYRR
ncbi:hypothetical protein M427DRAFT_145305 [Gonapodya prolifera JEL478]|uniref:Uncharacterized protein n=1 Tax=Gonapodya prolifera (strain JEL478) TaxID=1344416 RepID=A0A139AH06_GONPJ|nr:hypothetical protein M427DRAFT_145305 [Gonapodya prolifera JEL478]|eukprot:KXS16040.1 hypothetical protein M427DRAFT_145305 [Gonapodya prolifera JEL478]